MSFLGFHLLDWLILVLYMGVMIVIGHYASRKIKDTRDFYQGGRRFGKVLTAFLNFGQITSADQATGVSREIYRQGLSGLWFQNIVLFITPFYWFTSILQRRVRYVGPGDIYMHRFESRFLAGLYAFYILLLAMYGGAMGFLLTGKTMKALMVKPATEYSVEERASVEGFQEYKELTRLRQFEPLSEVQEDRLHQLDAQMKRGELEPYASYINLMMFYFLYAFIIATYTIMGGLFAAVVTDVLQGVLIIFLSLVLIPVGLVKLGGFEGLHATVPDFMFQLFGSATTSEYTWYFVAAMAVTNLIGLAPKNFTVGGSPKDDQSARIGMVVGSFSKRFIMIGWALTGLIAIGLYQGKLADPTMIWGHMTHDLLGVGFIGLMVASILAANMSSIDAQSLEWSAAFTKNILLPLFPRISERAQVLAGRLVIFVILFASIYFARKVDDVFVMFKYILSLGTVIGPALWLVYFWRRLTTKAVVIQMILTLMTTILIPNIAPHFDWIRSHPELTRQTPERVHQVETRALQSDVDKGFATAVGERIIEKRLEPSAAIFFNSVVRENPDDPASPWIGQGALRNQLLYLSWMGVPVERFSKSQLATASFAFDIVFPFVLLFGISLITRKNSDRVLCEFYGSVHTPVVSDPEEDARRVAEAVENPELVEQRKLFPGSQWEFWKPTKWDIWGFLLCWVLVGVIIGVYILVINIGSIG